MSTPRPHAHNTELHANSQSPGTISWTWLERAYPGRRYGKVFQSSNLMVHSSTWYEEVEEGGAEARQGHRHASRVRVRPGCWSQGRGHPGVENLSPRVSYWQRRLPVIQIKRCAPVLRTASEQVLCPISSTARSVSYSCALVSCRSSSMQSCIPTHNIRITIE